MVYCNVDEKYDGIVSYKLSMSKQSVWCIQKGQMTAIYDAFRLHCGNYIFQSVGANNSVLVRPNLEYNFQV